MLCVKFLLGVALTTFMWRAARRNGVSTGMFIGVVLLVAYALHAALVELVEVLHFLEALHEARAG